MVKQYTLEEEQRIRELFKEFEASFNAWGPKLEELFNIYGEYNDHHVAILQLLLQAMHELNFVEMQRGLSSRSEALPWEGNATAKPSIASPGEPSQQSETTSDNENNDAFNADKEVIKYMMRHYNEKFKEQQ